MLCIRSFCTALIATQSSENSLKLHCQGVDTKSGAEEGYLYLNMMVWTSFRHMRIGIELFDSNFLFINENPEE
jgi:hypothetical protein